MTARRCLLLLSISACLLFVTMLHLRKSSISEGETELEQSYTAPWGSAARRMYVRVGTVLIENCGQDEAVKLEIVNRCNAANVVAVRYLNCVKSECRHAPTIPPTTPPTTTAEPTGYYAYEGRPEFSGDFKNPYPEPEPPAPTPPPPVEKGDPWLTKATQQRLFSALLAKPDPKVWDDALWACGQPQIPAKSPTDFLSCLDEKCGVKSSAPTEEHELFGVKF